MSDGAGRNRRREKGAGRAFQKRPAEESGHMGEWVNGPLLVVGGWSAEQGRETGATGGLKGTPC